MPVLSAQPTQTVHILQDLTDAFQHSLRDPVTYEPAEERSSAYLGGLSVSDEVRIRKARKFQQAALRTAKNEDSPLARKLLSRADVLLDEDEMSRDGYDVGRHFFLAVRSYISYRDGDVSTSRGDMQRALSLVNGLRQRGRCLELDARRVHLARNLLRLDAHSDRPQRAATAAFGLLKYTVGAQDAWPYEQLRCTVADAPMIEAERYMMYDHIGRELALLLIQNAPEVGLRVVTTGQKMLDAPGESVPGEHLPRHIPATRAWLAAMEARLQQPTESFLVEATRAFRLGRPAPSLWISLVRDVLVALEEQSFVAEDEAPTDDGAPAAVQAIDQDIARLATELRDQILDLVNGDRKDLDAVNYTVVFGQ